MWTKETRVIGEPVPRVVVAGVCWALEIDLPTNTSFRAEMRSLPLEGFGQTTSHEYVTAGRARMLAFIRQHGLRLDIDQTTPGAIRMLVYRPNNPSVALQRAIDPQIWRHRQANPQEPCACCGMARASWRDDEACPAYVEALTAACVEPTAEWIVGPKPPTGWLSMPGWLTGALSWLRSLGTILSGARAIA